MSAVTEITQNLNSNLAISGQIKAQRLRIEPKIKPNLHRRFRGFSILGRGDVG